MSKNHSLTLTVSLADQHFARAKSVGIFNLATGLARRHSLEVVAAGTSRNWLFAAAHPVLRWGPPSRRRFTAPIHWLGWSAYLVAQKPQ